MAGVIPVQQFFDSLGHLAKSAPITVFQHGTTTLATLTDSTGASLPNPLSTDVIGNFNPFAPNGLYDLYSGATFIGTTLAFDGVGTWAGSYPAVAADIATGAVTSAKILDGTIVDADVSASAAIAESKIANLTTDLAGIGSYFKQAVQAATTAALPANVYANGSAGVGATLTASVNGALPTIDGYTVLLNDRLLVKNEAAAANDGIYVATNLGSAGTKWVLTRATDGDGPSDLAGGATVPVLNGTTLVNSQWTQTTKTVTIGTTAQTWVAGNVSGTQRRPGHFLVAASNANAVWKAQADYVCTGTADDVKINAAITACGAVGGWVELTDGTFTCAAAIALKDNIRLTGQAWAVTVLNFPTDLGAGNYALFDSGTGIQLNAPFVQNIRLVGPSTSTTKGVAPANMHGIKLGRNWTMDAVWVQGFHSGIVIWGDHQVLVNVTSTLNYYGLDHADSPPTGGNQYVAYSSFGGNNYASVHIGGNTSIIGATWREVTCGSSPYGFYRTDLAGGGASSSEAITDSIMDYVSFEAVGNAAIKDVSTGGLAFSDTTEWNHTGFSWEPLNKIAAEDANYAVNIPLGFTWNNSPINYGTSPFSIGALGTWLGAQGADFIQGQNRSRLWKGNGSIGNIAAGNLCGLHAADTVRLYDGAQPLVGVALTNWEAGSANRMTQVQFEGVVSVSSAATVALGDQLSVDPANTFQVHTRGSGEQPVGYALRAASGGLVLAWIQLATPTAGLATTAYVDAKVAANTATTTDAGQHLNRR